MGWKKPRPTSHAPTLKTLQTAETLLALPEELRAALMQLVGALGERGD